MSAPASAPPADVVAMFGNLNGSNGAKLALLERRFVVPASPTASRGEAPAGLVSGTQHSTSSCHSLREATPTRGPSSSLPPCQSWPGPAAIDLPGADRKRRRESDVGVSFAQESVSRNAVKDQNQMPFRVETTCSPPSAATGQRPSLSPFLAHAQDSSQRLEAPASASKKARNTIARYFASTSAGEGGSLGVGGHTTEEALRSSVAALEAAEQQASLHRSEDE